jgi:hypothetical protein
MDDVSSRGENPQKKAMLDAKHILKDIILKLATESFKQRFLALPLNEQRGFLGNMGLHREYFLGAFTHFKSGSVLELIAIQGKIQNFLKHKTDISRMKRRKGITKLYLLLTLIGK